jgi:hypothetical protein
MRWILVGGVLPGHPFSLETLIVQAQRLLLALIGLDLGALEQLVRFQKIRVGHLGIPSIEKCLGERASIAPLGAIPAPRVT